MRRHPRLALSLSLALAGLSAGVPAAAQDAKAKAAGETSSASPADAKDEASKHYQRGVAFYGDGDYKLALVEFRRAYELTHNYRVLYNIGQVNQQLNNYSRALQALEQYLAEGADAVPTSRRESVLADIAQLRTKIAQIEIAVNVAQADVFVDGELVGRSPLPKPVLLDAGDHRIEARREGYQPATTTVTLATRDNTRVDVRMVEAKATPAPTVAAVAPVQRSSLPPVRRGPSTLAWAGWISTGALAAGAAVTGVLALSEANRLTSLRDSPTSTASEREGAQQSAQGFAVATDVLAASALVVGATTLYFTLRRESAPQHGPAATKIGVGPSSVFLSGEF